VKNHNYGSAEPIIGNTLNAVAISAGWSVIYYAPDSTENATQQKRHFPTYCLPGASRGGFFYNERAISWRMGQGLKGESAYSGVLVKRK